METDFWKGIVILTFAVYHLKSAKYFDIQKEYFLTVNNAVKSHTQTSWNEGIGNYSRIPFQWQEINGLFHNLPLRPSGPGVLLDFISAMQTAI